MYTAVSGYSSILNNVFYSCFHIVVSASVYLLQIFSVTNPYRQSPLHLFSFTYNDIYVSLFVRLSVSLLQLCSFPIIWPAHSPPRPVTHLSGAAGVIESRSSPYQRYSTWVTLGRLYFLHQSISLHVTCKLGEIWCTWIGTVKQIITWLRER